jgi:cell fate regulator YaaT (PSP1 superfamily)
MKKIVSVRFKENGKSYSFEAAGLPIRTGDFVVVSTARGTECGEVTQGVHEAADAACPRELKSVVRMADSVDVRRWQAARDEEKKAFSICQERIARHGLDMKLVDAEYAADRSKILFYFTADGRVDFRELVKDLASVFHTRIELRQIGVRDESKMLGGLGICGQPFCCSRFLRDFQPVSIKMAKEQNLSLNPTKISGCCGRLMCCLSYEQKAYEYLNGVLPMQGSTVRTPDGVGTVVEVNPMSCTLRVRTGTDSLAPKTYKADQCEYLSGGKRAPRAPDPYDDFSGMNPHPLTRPLPGAEAPAPEEPADALPDDPEESAAPAEAAGQPDDAGAQAKAPSLPGAQTQE